jgi:hypothetical protein
MTMIRIRNLFFCLLHWVFGYDLKHLAKFGSIGAAMPPVSPGNHRFLNFFSPDRVSVIVSFKVNSIKSFKLIGRIIFYRAALIVDHGYVHNITPVDIGRIR